MLTASQLFVLLMKLDNFVRDSTIYCASLLQILTLRIGATLDLCTFIGVCIIHFLYLVLYFGFFDKFAH